MKRSIFIFLTLILAVGCGDGDSHFEDNRECIVFVDTDADNIPREAEGAGLDVTAVDGDIEACGTSVQVAVFVERLEDAGSSALDDIAGIFSD